MSEKLSDTEISLTDALKSVIDILIARKLADGRELDLMFSSQRDAYLQKKMPTAAAVMELLREFSVDRASKRSLLSNPPAGNA